MAINDVLPLKDARRYAMLT